MNISFNMQFKAELTQAGIEKYLEYIDAKIEKMQEVYQFTTQEILSFRQNLESNIKDGNIVFLQLNDMCTIFADDSMHSNYSKYIKDGIISTIPGQLSIYNKGLKYYE